MAETKRVEEAYEERDETINASGDVIEVEIPYFAFGYDDESSACTSGSPTCRSSSSTRSRAA